MKTLEQQFAAQIYDQVLPYKGKEEAERKQYGSMTYTLPILVRSAGLAQALAFVASRKKDVYDQLLDHLAKVVLGNTADKEGYLEQSRKAEMQEYMRLTRRTMLALKWYKRFAESVLDVKSTDANDVSAAGGTSA